MGPGRRAALAAIGRFVGALGANPLRAGVEAALDALRAAAAADACELFIGLDGDPGDAVLLGCAGADRDAFCSCQRFARGLGYPGIVIATGAPLRTADLEGDPRYLRRDVLACGYRAYACAPVSRSGRVLGSLHLAWKRRDADLAAAMALLADASIPLGAALAVELFELRGGVFAGAPDLRAAADRLRAAVAADAVSLWISGDEPASAGCDRLICECLARRRATRPGGQRILAGARERWPAGCRGLPDGFGGFVCLPVEGTAAPGIALLAFRQAPAQPASRHLPALAAVLEGAVHAVRRPVVPVAVSPVGAAPLELRCLGAFEVVRDRQPIAAAEFARSKAIELLKLLAVRQAPMPAEQLAELLWPGADPARSQPRLHVTVHALRRAVEADPGSPRVVVRTAAGYSLDPEHHQCDLRTLRQLVAAAHEAQAEMRPLADAARLLERATALWRGDLFAEDPYADWCAGERERYRQMYLDALVHLARLRGQLGGAHDPIEPLRHAALVDPLREDLQQGLLRALLRAGLRAEARRRYRDLVGLLDRELGVGPQAATRRLGEMAGGEPVT